MSFFRPNIDVMTGYVPGEQPKPGTQILKLNTNENPYPPSPAAMAVLRQIGAESLRRYPDPYAKEFCQAVAELEGIPSDWVMVGNGSDDILNIVIRACAEGSRTVAYPVPTYVLYRTLSQLQPAQVIEIPYGSGYELPIADLIQAQAAVTFIASPNSPSGHQIPSEDLRTLAASLSGVLVIDEAYVDFAEASALPLVREFANVLVSRTLSKGYSLAGLRLGYGIAQPPLLSGLFKVKDSYNIDAIAIQVGSAALRDQTYKWACANRVKGSRHQLSQDLQALGFKVWPSQANFVLTQPPQSAQTLYLALKENGILVRYFNQPGLDDKLRITVGSPEENQQVIAALPGILRQLNCVD